MTVNNSYKIRNRFCNSDIKLNISLPGAILATSMQFGICYTGYVAFYTGVLFDTESFIDSQPEKSEIVTGRICAIHLTQPGIQFRNGFRIVLPAGE
jgi:hypothetical protein